VALVVDSLDHLVLTVADAARAIDFYVRVLGMQEITFGEGRKAVAFGSQKINLHVAGAEVAPHARVPVVGSADVCFLTGVPLPQAMAHVTACGVAIELGPVMRTGATGPITSFYVRDPDGNLIEVANKAP
jgi:catechol 2,3-dioxygenase-like lactoylglutathione lyase family enzyme